MWIIQKRVANTTRWGRVGCAETREQAVSAAENILGGRSTGVRIVEDTEYAEPVLVVGTDSPAM